MEPGLIGTGEYSFDAPKLGKGGGAGCGPIDCTWHVPRVILQTFAKIFSQIAGQTNVRIRLKLDGPIATTARLPTDCSTRTDDSKIALSIIEG